MTAGKNDDTAKTSKVEELNDSDLEAVAGGLAASGTGNIKAPAFKVEIEGVAVSAAEAAQVGDDALSGKR